MSLFRATPLLKRGLLVIWALYAAAASGALVARETSLFRILGLAGLGVLLPVAITQPDLLVVPFVGLLWGRVSDLGIVGQGLPSLVVPSALGLIGLALLRRLNAGERIGLRTFSQLFPLLPYFAIVTLSATWAAEPGRAQSTAVDLGKDLLIFWVLVELITSVGILRACCVSLCLVAGALSALSIYQHLTGTFSNAYGGFAQASVRQIVDRVESYRVAGPIGDPNFYALILLVTVPLGLAMLATRLPLVVRGVVGGAVMLTCGAVLLTYSRGGALVLALGVLAVLIHSRIRWRLLALAVVALPIIALALTPSSMRDRLATVLRPVQDTALVGQTVDTSVELRLGAQLVALEMFLDQPFVGVGAGNYPLLYPDYSRELGVVAVGGEFYPHNLYLQVAAETGSIGLLAFLVAVGAPITGLQRLRRTGQFGPEQVGVAVALGCYLVASLMLHGSYPRYLWMLLALAVASQRVAPTLSPRS
jgi:O-antigen ligase